MSSRWIQSLTNGANGASSRHDDHQHLVQRRERRAVVRRVDVVEARAIEAHVPVRDVVDDEVHERARRRRRIVVARARRRPRARPSRAATASTGPSPADPPTAGSASRRRPAEVRVLREDPAVHVLEREEEAARQLADHALVEAARHPHLARRDEEEPHRIGAVLRRPPPTGSTTLPRALRHLRALRRRAPCRSRRRRDTAPPASSPLFGSASPEPRRDREQRVEPSARLVHALGDEVRRDTASPASSLFSNG